MNWPGHGVLQIGVAPLEDWVRERNRFYDPGFVSKDPGFHHAHITVLAPLHEWNLGAISAIAQRTPPFDIVLNEVDVFRNGIIHLIPTPGAPLRELTRQVWAAHPSVVPNGAPNPTPHLTLDAVSTTVDLASTRRAIAALLPAHHHVFEMQLAWYESGNCHEMHRWRLGGHETMSP